MFSDTKKELIEFCISLQVAKVRSVRRRNVDRDVITGCVESDDGTAADAYSTALYVMGEQEAVSFWRAHGGFDLILITADGRLLYTPELADTITAPEGCAYDFQPIIAQPAA